MPDVRVSNTKRGFISFLRSNFVVKDENIKNESKTRISIPWNCKKDLYVRNCAPDGYSCVSPSSLKILSMAELLRCLVSLRLRPDFMSKAKKRLSSAKVALVSRGAAVSPTSRK
jgi:hypothetical protein